MHQPWLTPTLLTACWASPSQLCSETLTANRTNLIQSAISTLVCLPKELPGASQVLPGLSKAEVREQNFINLSSLLPCDQQLCRGNSCPSTELIPRTSPSLDHAASSQLQKKITHFHLQKPSRSLLENGLGGQAAYYLLSGKEPGLPPKLSLLSVQMRLVIHPALRQLG